MGVLSKAISLFRGRDRRLEGARKEEARGNLEQALALYLEAGAREDAARLQMARAEMAASPQERYQLLGQALALAQAEARGPVIRRRAELALVLFRQGSLLLTRPELLALAREVEQNAAPALAAELYELGGDLESRTRALVEAGAIDQLEQVLSDEAESERARRERDAEVRRISDLDACGRRREALALARALEQEDERVRALAGRIEARRTRSETHQLMLGGECVEVAFGAPATVGRADATVVIRSPSISRQHLVLRPTDRGPEVADLGSRNGTTLRGVRLCVPVLVGEALTLLLGGQVELRLQNHPGGGLSLETLSRRVLLPLGPLRLEGMSLERADDGWLELHCESAVFIDGLRVDGRCQLCIGDKLALAPDGPVQVEVLA